MKLFSAAGLDDLLNPANYVDRAGIPYPKRLGYLDLFHMQSGSFVPTASPGKGMSLPVYTSVLSISMRDVQADNTSGTDWVVFGAIIQGDDIAGNYNTSPAFGLGRADSWSASNTIGLTREQIINTFGGGKPVCVEILYQPSTGTIKQYINGVLRWNSTITAIGGVAVHRTLLINPYQVSDNGRRMVLSEYYLGTTTDENFRLGNFKVSKLVAKSTTLPPAALIADDTVALVTGQHSVTFDAAPLSTAIVAGVVERVRVASPGPTAGITIKRTVNGTTTAAASFKDIPTVVPSFSQDDSFVAKVLAPPTDYVLATPLSEVKVSLEMISNV